MVNIQTRQVRLLNAVTGTATSVGAPVDNAGRLSLMVFASGVTTGSATFYAEVSNDSTLGWVPYNRLTTNAQNTNAQNDARVGSLTQASNGTSMLFFPPGDTFNSIRVRGDITGVGTYSVILYAD